MTLSLADIQTIEGLIAAKMDLVSAFRDLPENDREQIAQDIERYLYARAPSLRQPENFYTPQITVSGNNINADENGVSRGHAGPTLPRRINFPGATGYLTSTDFSEANIVTAGGGADCMFDYLVSSCFATLEGFSEGDTFTSVSGCTFKGYSTVSGCMTQVGTDMVADNTFNASVLICHGTYTESATWTTGATSVGSLTIYGSGMGQTVMVGNFTFDGLNSTDDYVVVHDLTVSGTISTSGDANTGDRMRFRHVQCTDLALNANAGDCEFIGVIIDDAITLGANVSELHFIDCSAATILNSGNLTNFYWIGGQITGSITLQQWDTAVIDTRFTGNGSAGYHFRGTGSGCHGLILKGFFQALAATAAARNYIEFAQGATDAIDTIIDVFCEKPTSTSFEVHYLENKDTDPMHGAYVRIAEGTTATDTTLVDMTGNYSSVEGPFKECVFELHPGAKVDLASWTGFNMLNGMQYFAGTPTHGATEGQQCWDVTNNLLYINTSSTYGTTWSGAASVGGAATAHTLLDGAVHSDTAADTVSRGSLIYGNSTPAWDELTIGSAETILSSDGTDVSWRAHYITQILVFTPEGANLASGSLLPNPGVCIGESGEHGTFALIRAKAIAGTAGSGTNTIVIEADDNPAFSSATTIYTLALNTSTEVDDVSQDTAWTSTDIFLRARCTAVDASPPSNVVVFLYLKQQVENF